MTTRTHYIIGNGGVGSWLVPALLRLIGPDHIVLVDGDTLEPKNLDRQLFETSDIGKPKAEALARRYGIRRFIPDYFSLGSIEGIRSGDLLFLCVDNHAARRAALSTADLMDCEVVIGANEYVESEAYWYLPAWKETPLDPRVFYPGILTDTSGDPTRPESCTGDAADATPQLVLANKQAASLMESLFWFHGPGNGRAEFPEDYWPVHHKANALKLHTINAVAKRAA